MAKLVDVHVSGACAARREGSSPSFGTWRKIEITVLRFFISAIFVNLGPVSQY